ncbi:MAG: PKD domain-containing protein [Acidobacteriota bacterium]|nr:PKD domain-containing protein [Acidobacteriota bacterium]
MRRLPRLGAGLAFLGLSGGFGAFGAQSAGTLPETMSEGIVSDFIEANDVGTVEAFIQALPPLHKTHFIALHSSMSPAADHVSSTYPRIVSWGADSRFIVTWTTDPESPSREQVEFLQPAPTEGKWIAGVIDFSEDPPTVSKPATCAACHSSINRPIWGGQRSVSGTEEDRSSAARTLYETMSTSADPRISALQTDGYSDWSRAARFIPGITFRFSAMGQPSWAFARTILSRQAEVLFARLMARDDADAILKVLLGRNRFFMAKQPWFVGEEWDARILSGTGEPVQGWTRSGIEIFAYDPAGVRLTDAVQFLAMREARGRSENVRAFYRSVPNTFHLPTGHTFDVGLHFRAGEATFEEEFMASWNEFFESSGQAHLDARQRRVHPAPTEGRPFGRYNEHALSWHWYGAGWQTHRAYAAPPPFAPPVLSSVVSGRRSLTVEWAAPAGVDPEEIQRYEARTIRGDAADRPDAAWTLHAEAWTSGPLRSTVSGLLDDVSYDVQVRAAGSADFQAPSGWSSALSGRTLANRPPVPVGTLAAAALRMGEGGVTVDVAVSFRDDDGDALTYAAVSSAPGVARAEVSGGRVTLTPAAVGAATVEVTATDAAGSKTTARQTFAARVKGARGVTVSASTLAVTEGSQGTYTVVLDAEPDGEVTVTPVVPAGTDVSVEPVSLTFGTTGWDKPRTVSVSAAADPDAVSDPAVTIEHRVAGAGYGSVNAPSVSVLAVETDSPTLSVSSANAVESSGAVVFQVAISTATDREVTVDFATRDGSASSAAGADFTASAGTLRFAPMSTGARRVEVAVRDDELDEGTGETFLLTLANAVNAALAGGEKALSVTGTILDDDEPSPPPGPSSPSPGPSPPPPSGPPSPSPSPPPRPPSPPPGPPPPTGSLQADFVIDPNCAGRLCTAWTGQAVRFHDTSSGAVRHREWSFGDGRSSGGVSVAHVWTAPGFHEVALTVGDGRDESRASRRFLVEAADPDGSCVADDATRCLLDSRYRVTVDWWREDGEQALARVVREGTNDSALFAFFDPGNWEVLVKVLDGCSTNGHVWVYGASTTDLGYAIQVTDTVTGAVKEYRNETGRAAGAIADVTAFPGSCG